jgi:hypothetical protein
VKTAWSNTKQTRSTSPGTTAPASSSATPAGTIKVQNQKYSFMPGQPRRLARAVVRSCRVGTTAREGRERQGGRSYDA